ncbi:PTS sugar transporter subunit IIB [Pelosinus sp. IPA-1]|uniref:PTS sugar transporter subunit IIB n=1 Tax=Pelosinus sp. IPA-1 TaxID=3029569 RepID=UPI0024361FB9|nr:PTS sugar transporter subunit IIB [Pelosinus sp. IPA-1]GMA97379.1 PTS ascorbate transporter subunit IIB [Pelosinus sp. IPA-1]
MKILVCCSGGLDSSSIIEVNIKKILKEFEVEAQVDHTDLSSASSIKADVYVGTREIVGQLLCLGGRVISLNNIIDMKELRDKLSVVLQIPLPLPGEEISS